MKRSGSMDVIEGLATVIGWFVGIVFVVALLAGFWWLYGWGILIIGQNLSDVFGWGWELPMTHAARFWTGLGASFITGLFGGNRVYNNKK